MIAIVLGFTPAEIGDAFNGQEPDEVLEAILHIIGRQDNPEFTDRLIVRLGHDSIHCHSCKEEFPHRAQDLVAEEADGSSD